MAYKPVECTDERGQRWIVYEGDPGWEPVRRLYMRDVRDIVLPHETLRTGLLVKVSVPATMAAWDVSNPSAAALLRRFVRLRDCCHYLEAPLGVAGLGTDDSQGTAPAVATDQHHGAG